MTVSLKRVEELKKELIKLNDLGRTRLTLDEFYTLARKVNIIETYAIKETLKYFVAIGLLTQDGMILIFRRDSNVSDLPVM